MSSLICNMREQKKRNKEKQVHMIMLKDLDQVIEIQNELDRLDVFDRENLVQNLLIRILINW